MFWASITTPESPIITGGMSMDRSVCTEMLPSASICRPISPSVTETWPTVGSTS